jgi:mRNA interferase RelE/StbE
MTYRVTLTKPASKQLNDLTNEIASRILARIENLKTEPRPPDVKKLKGREGWRIRIGDYRVIYTIHDNQLVILVIMIRHRRDVYR